jgi:hypothetical protein
LPLSAEDDNDLEHWLGIDPVAVVAESLLLNRGTPGDGFVDVRRFQPGTPTGRYFLRRVWVEADIVRGIVLV